MPQLNTSHTEQAVFPTLALGRRPSPAELASILDSLVGHYNFNKNGERAGAFGYAMGQLHSGPLLRPGLAVLFRQMQAQRWAGEQAPSVEFVALTNSTPDKSELQY